MLLARYAYTIALKCACVQQALAREEQAKREVERLYEERKRNLLLKHVRKIRLWCV